MPSNWLTIDAKMPTFTGRETPEEMVKALTDYIFELTNQLKYQLRHLDISNWDKNALDNYTEESTSEIQKAIEQLKRTISEANQNLNQIIAKLDDNITNVNTCRKEVEGLKTTLTENQNAISDINNKVSNNENEITRIRNEMIQINKKIDANSTAIEALKGGGTK